MVLFLDCFVRSEGDDEMSKSRENGKYIYDKYEECTKIFRSGLTDILYHYCSLDAFIKIMKQGKQRLTLIKALNDSDELKSSLEFIGKYLMSRQSQVDVKTVLPGLNTLNRVFVLSLSRDPDSLPLWYNYAQGDGINFSLCEEKLRSIVGFEKQHPEVICYSKEDSYETMCNNLSGNHGNYPFKQAYEAIFGSVVYDDDQKEKVLAGLVDSFVQMSKLYGSDQKSVESGLKKKLLQCSVLFKNSSFETEKEVRFAIVIHPSLTRKENCFDFKFEHCVGYGLIRPYAEVNILQSQGESFAQYVCIGPRNKQDSAKESVEDYLNYLERENFKVTNSKVPLRF